MPLLVLIAVLTGSAPTEPAVEDPRAVAAIERFESAWQATSTLRYRLLKRERVKSGATIEEEALIKWTRRPACVYLAAKKPREGQEVIYCAERDGRELIVHPGRFPDVTLKLDLGGSLATRNQRHPITHVGFDYTLAMIRASRERAKREPHGEQMLYDGSRNVRGRRGIVVTLLAGSRAATTVTARKGDTVLSLAERVGRDGYGLVMANEKVSSLGDELASGRPVVVPAYYAARSEIVLDTETGLPLEQTSFDEAGKLLEAYGYTDVEVNPTLTAQDFDPENPAYDF